MLPMVWQLWACASADAASASAVKAISILRYMFSLKKRRALRAGVCGRLATKLVFLALKGAVHMIGTTIVHSVWTLLAGHAAFLEHPTLAGCHHMPAVVVRNTIVVLLAGAHSTAKVYAAHYLGSGWAATVISYEAHVRSERFFRLARLHRRINILPIQRGKRGRQ